jgi:D-alanine-D-alanine ligase
VRLKVAVVYNQPEAERYQAMGENLAELGVLDEVKAVRRSLDELGCFSLLVPLRPPLEQVLPVLKGLKKLRPEVIFNLFEGFDGRPETESAVAGMLAELKIPFTGCPPSALALALDKAGTKAILDRAGIPTPGYQVLNPAGISTFKLDYPCIVKPLAEDASHGLSEESVVHNMEALGKQVRKISRLFGGQALVEEFISGREFNTTVMGNRQLTIPAISEIVYTLPPDKPRILTFESKWEENSLYYKNTKAVCPAHISPAEQQEISRIAKAAFRLTDCRGYARVDLRQDSRGNFRVLEVNPNPDITPGAGAALQAAAAGLSYPAYIQKIIALALTLPPLNKDAY